jgi:hypothetical protein
MALPRSEREIGGKHQTSSLLNKLEARPPDLEAEGCHPLTCDLRMVDLLLAGLDDEERRKDASCSLERMDGGNLVAPR